MGHEYGISKMKKLTGKQNRFVAAYLETGCKVTAYRRAYDCTSMNDRTVTRKAQEVAALSHVAEAIRNQEEAAMDRSAVTLDRIIQGLTNIAFADVAEILHCTDGVLSLKSLDALSPRQRAAIKEIAVEKDGRVQVKMHDALRALEALGKHFGMFDKRSRETSDVPLIQLFMPK